jgi:hypothetical protein
LNGGKVYVVGSCDDGGSWAATTYDPTSDRWSAIPQPSRPLGFVPELISVGQYVVAWSEATTQVYDTHAREWWSLPLWPGNNFGLYGTTDGTHLVAVGAEPVQSETIPPVIVSSFDFTTRAWTERRVVNGVPHPVLPMLAHVAAAADGRVVWAAGTAGWVDLQTGAHGTLGRSFGPVLAVGERRFFVWREAGPDLVTIPPG